MRVPVPALATFFGSFLLFGIQPMLGRTLLPSFGGSAAVWTVCLAAYQILLLLGYAYAHVIAHRSPRLQRRLHLGLLAWAVLWAFGFAAARLLLRDHLGTTAAPSIEVLVCVLVFVGLPYILLSANSTLIQAWLADTGQSNVYTLYAVSNFGSLSGLLVYPLLLEPFVSLNAQWYGFSACLLLYTLLLCVVAKKTLSPLSPTACRLTTKAVSVAHEANLPPALTQPWLWLALPTLSTFLLNAATTHLSTDVTPVPMMWALLLTTFLTSYCLGFSSIGERGLIVWASLAVLSLAGAGLVSGQKGGHALLPNLSFGLFMLLSCCTCLHGWLYRIRPHATKLTRFYLGIAGGGALGGALASLASPLLFDRVWEYPLALLALCATFAWLIHTWDHQEVKGLSRFLLSASAVTVLLVIHYSVETENTVLLRKRNFYACLRVEKEDRALPSDDVLTLVSLIHGETLHGLQAKNSFLRRTPTTYYAAQGGGLAVTSHPNYGNRARPMRVGLIGLGAGTLACYGRTNDVYRFFEINPAVIAVATDTNCFSFVADSLAKTEIVLGDARKLLESERKRQESLYDVLVVDAFSGDSVPFHLITSEAFELYLNRLAPNGTLALHISNWHINLAPLCKAAAHRFGLHLSGILSPRLPLTTAAHWAFLTREPFPIGSIDASHTDWNGIRSLQLPDDEKGSLLSLMHIGIETPSKLDVQLSF